MTAALGTADAQVARVLELVGVHAHAINALLTVSTVEWSDATATACVECVDRPRLLLNPAFVAQGDILVGYRTGGWFRLVLVGCETQEAGDLLTAVYEKIAPPDVRVHTHLERERQPGE